MVNSLQLNGASGFSLQKIRTIIVIDGMRFSIEIFIASLLDAILYMGSASNDYFVKILDEKIR